MSIPPRSDSGVPASLATTDSGYTCTPLGYMPPDGARSNRLKTSRTQRRHASGLAAPLPLFPRNRPVAQVRPSGPSVSWRHHFPHRCRWRGQVAVLGTNTVVLWVNTSLLLDVALCEIFWVGTSRCQAQLLALPFLLWAWLTDLWALSSEFTRWPIVFWVCLSPIKVPEVHCAEPRLVRGREWRIIPTHGSCRPVWLHGRRKKKERELVRCATSARILASQQGHEARPGSLAARACRHRHGPQVKCAR